MSLVLDASMAIASLFVEEQTDAVREVVRLIASEGAVVPSIWRLEVANALSMAVRRGRCDESHFADSLVRLERLAIAVDDQTDRNAWGTTLKLAREQRLTVYDAAYLELAVRLGLPLATGDRELIVAAQRLGVAVLTP